jgi:hypothetical protein
MKTPTLFLNELSLTADRELDPQELLPHVLATLTTARKAKKLRRELIVAGGLAGVVFGTGPHTFASILRGADYREEWRFLKELDQTSPDGPEDWKTQGKLQEVQFQGIAGIGLLQAIENKSAILSFAFRQAWESPIVLVTHWEVDESDDFSSMDKDLQNLAKPEHVTIHEEFIQTLAMDLSSSSIIYEGEDFVLRMYFNDHDPPHFHVMANNDSSETIARFEIKTLDQLAQSGRFRPALRRKVFDWAESRKDALMGCWQECRKLRHPPRLD